MDAARTTFTSLIKPFSVIVLVFKKVYEGKSFNVSCKNIVKTIRNNVAYFGGAARPGEHSTKRWFVSGGLENCSLLANRENFLLVSKYPAELDGSVENLGIPTLMYVSAWVGSYEKFHRFVYNKGGKLFRYIKFIERLNWNSNKGVEKRHGKNHIERGYKIRKDIS